MHRSPLLVLLAVAGCGSADSLPAPEAPSSRSGSAVLDTRARTLTVGDETVDAGAGPSQLAESGDRVYVLDAVQGALLVFEKEPDLHLQRRAYLPGRPTGLEVSADAVIVAVDGERVEFTPGGVER